MSDAMWDYEYDQAESIFKKAQELAIKNNVSIPDELKLGPYPRIWQAEKTMEYVKSKIN